MSRIIDYCIMLFHICFRHVDFPTNLRLIKIGNPDENSHVIITGNYIYTVRRLIKILKGFDCYLLVAKSSGSNVWCAAGMGEFSEHDIVDIINFSGISNIVKHRTLILQPAAAVGVDTKIVREKTGWNVKWAPYHFIYLPKYLRNNTKKTKEMYKMPFPLRDRIEMAIGTATMTSLTPLFISFFWMRELFLGITAMIVVVTLFNFVCYPLLPREKYFRKSLLAFGFLAAGLAGWGYYNLWGLTEYIQWEIILAGVMFISCADMCGSTTLVKTTVSHWMKSGNYESLFEPIVNPNECIGCRVCIEVCPKGVYEVNNKKVFAKYSKECCECLACIKQCSRNAIYNKNIGRYKHDIKSILNLDELMNRRINF